MGPVPVRSVVQSTCPESQIVDVDVNYYDPQNGQHMAPMSLGLKQ